MHENFVNIEAAKEGGFSWTELEELPAWRREWLIAKIAEERRAEKFLTEKAQRDAKRNKK